MTVFIYYKNNTAYRRKSEDFADYMRREGFEVKRLPLDVMSRSHLEAIVKHSTDGFTSVLLRGYGRSEYRHRVERVLEMSYSQAITHLLAHPELLRSMFIIDTERKLYMCRCDMSEVMRQFKSRARIELERYTILTNHWREG